MGLSRAALGRKRVVGAGAARPVPVRPQQRKTAEVDPDAMPRRGLPNGRKNQIVLFEEGATERPVLQGHGPAGPDGRQLLVVPCDDETASFLEASQRHEP